MQMMLNNSQPQIDDYLMFGVAVLESLKSSLHPNQRVQISASELNYVKQAVGIVISSHLQNYAQQLTLAMTRFSNIIKVIDEIVSDAGFTETDNEQKSFILKLYNDACHDVLMFAGRYYDTGHAFTVSQSQFELYKSIIGYNINNGYYFGKEQSIKE